MSLRILTDMEQTIVDIVTDRNGLKMTELIANLPRKILSENEGEVIMNTIQTLIDEEYLVEVEYILPNMSYRRKSFLLPGNTRAKINNNTWLVD